MRICFIEIENFRGIKLSRFPLDEALVCFIGAGDSSKSTIIDAIEYTLSPNWYLPIDDSDFYNCEIGEPIVIKVTIKPPHEDFWVDTKFGLCLRGWNNEENIIVDDPSADDTLDKVLTIQLKIDESLAPEWHVVTDRNPTGDHISSKDRQKLGVSRIGDSIASELSWSRGSALSRLTQDKAEAEKIILEANRDLRSKINSGSFENLSGSIVSIKNGFEELGLNIGELKASIDPEIVRSRIGALSLHQENVPARRLGLGSRRLLAIAAQLQCVNQGSVMLIDEIETALEPHKIKHLLRVLKSKVDGENSGQFIFTSHHAAVIEELGCGPLFTTITDDAGNVTVEQIPAEIQGTVRNMPEALLAPKVVVCEGATEIGLLRAFEEKLLNYDIKTTFAFNQVVIVDARGGANVSVRAEALKNIGKKVSVFMDSDVNSYIPTGNGIEVVAWDDGLKTEDRIDTDLPIDARERFNELTNNTGTFKTVSGGEKVGTLLFEEAIFNSMSGKDFHTKMEQLKVWVNG